jgi:hypothetical protein
MDALTATEERFREALWAVIRDPKAREHRMEDLEVDELEEGPTRSVAAAKVLGTLWHAQGSHRLIALDDVLLRKNKEKIIDGICNVYLKKCGLNGFLAGYQEVLLCRRELIEILQPEMEITFADLFSTPPESAIRQGEYQTLSGEEEEEASGPSNPWEPFEGHIRKAGSSFNKMFKGLADDEVDIAPLIETYCNFLDVHLIPFCCWTVKLTQSLILHFAGLSGRD